MDSPKEETKAQIKQRARRDGQVYVDFTFSDEQGCLNIYSAVDKEVSEEIRKFIFKLIVDEDFIF